MDDSLWHVGLSDAAMLALFGGIVLLSTIVVVVVDLARRESPTSRAERATGSDAVRRIVARREARAREVAHDMDDETGRSDPAVVWTR
ncbi:hypothetical protein [Brachybacterium huguangmaarense]